MKTKLAIALLVLVGGIIFNANPSFAADSTINSVGATNEHSAFKIIVTPRKNRVHVGEKFKVRFEVKNVSKTKQTFKVWSCSWDENWRSSNPDIDLPGSCCLANWVDDVSLAPGESFKQTLNKEDVEMCVSQSVTTNKIIFRMGFAPSAWGDMHIYNPAQKSWRTNQWWIEDFKKAYWSDKVTISINPKSIPDWIPW